MTIPTADGDLLHYSAVASEPLESASKAPAAEVAANACLRRAAALAGLGLEYGIERRKPDGDLLQYLQIIGEYEILVQNDLD